MNYTQLYQWTEAVTSSLPCLNVWQQVNVALFTQGVIKAESCQQGQVARQVACGEEVESASRRWRRFLDNGRFPLRVFFVHWTRWVLSALGQARVSLLVDETKLGEWLAAMVVGVAWEGRCIPLAWRGYRANSSADYPPEGQVALIADLLRVTREGIPAGVSVLVLADRGIGTSPDLCRAVDDLGWKYLFRVTSQCKICTEQGEFTIADMVQPGEVWAASGRVFKRRGQIPAHARSLWSLGYDQPWALVTNDDTLTGHEYLQRNWQEQSFRDLKSAGWQWDTSRIRLPDHLERLLVILVIAYAFILSLGSRAVLEHRAQPLQRHPHGSSRRHFSLFREGLLYFVEVVQRYAISPPLAFFPDHRFT